VNILPLDEVTDRIIAASIKIHRDLGPGLLESVYMLLLANELEKKDLHLICNQYVDFAYDGITFKNAFRIDLLVDHRVIVELKSVERTAPVHSKQLLTYLRLMNLSVGLLINFGAATLKEGLHRIVNNLSPSASPRLRVNNPDAHHPETPINPATHLPP
jgi:GxxExxY protein